MEIKYVISGGLVILVFMLSKVPNKIKYVVYVYSEISSTKLR